MTSRLGIYQIYHIDRITSFCIQIVLKLNHSGAFAVFFVPCPPCLYLALFAAIPMSSTLGALLEFLAILSFLRAVGA